MLKKLLAVFHSSPQQEFDDELRFHLEKQVELNMGYGMSPEEARRQALIAFGGVQQTRESVRAVRWSHFASVLLQDARYAWRLLRKSPGFTTIAVLTLALGIGMNTAIFSLISAALFRPLPADHPEQLVLLSWHARHTPKAHSASFYGYCPNRWTDNNPEGCSLSLPWFQSVRTQTDLFSGVAAFAGGPALDLSGNGSATIVNYSQLVSGDFFKTLGIQAALGRTLLPGDDSPTAAPVLVLSYSYWKTEFAGEPGAVGRVVRLNGLPFTIVGVAEEKFEGLAPGNRFDLWLPLSARPVLEPRSTLRENDPGSWWIAIVGRLKPGVPRKQAGAALQVRFRNETENGDKPLFTPADDPRIDLVPAREGLTGARNSTLQPLYVLMMAVGLVLLIACANLGGLLLARAAGRRREIAVRLTLGARRARIISQLWMESAILAVLGGCFGLLLGRWASRLIPLLSRQADSRPFPFAPHLDGSVLAFTFAASVLTMLLFGLAPALDSLRVDVAPALKSAGAGVDPEGRRWFSMANILVVAQLTLAIVALASAGLMVRTLRNLREADLGFNPHNILLFSINPTLAGYKGLHVDDLYHDLQQRFAALPGVNSVSYSLYSILGGSYSSTDFHPPGTAAKDTAEMGILSVGPHFFSAMQIPFLAGRDLSSPDFAIAEADAARPPGADPNPKASPMPAIANQLLVKKFFPHTNPLGRRLEAILPDDPKHPRGPGWVIVGVVGNARYYNLRSEISPMIYVPSAGDNVSFVLRSSVDPRQLVTAVRDIVNHRDSNLALSHIVTESEQIDRLVFVERLVAQLSTFFAVLALLLACAGIYGLLSYEVTRRTREIGIRMAIGAQQSNVIGMVVKHGLALAFVGAALGVVASFGATRLLDSLLYGVHAGDPITLMIVGVLLLLVALAACFLPARRATRVDPLVALRYE